MNDSKVFVDTNIIVYAHDTSAGEKHNIAKNILIDLWESGRGTISTQVLQEFFVTVTKKIPRPLKTEKAEEIIRNLVQWEVIVVRGPMILSAIKTHRKHKYSFWDSLIIEAAHAANADILYSENLKSGHAIKSIQIINPFLK